MASIKIDGLEQYEKKLDALGKDITGILKRGVYDGADKVADAVRSSLSSLPVSDDAAAIAAYRRGEPGRLTAKQKAGLLRGLGLSKMQNNDMVVNTKLSFSGYNDVKTQKYPKGQPNLMIAASIENGTSASQRQPFMRPAVNKSKAAAKAAMEETVSSEINNLMEGK